MARDFAIDGLRVILFSVLLSEAIDDVKGTTLYKTNIKQAGNRLQKMLEPNIRQLDDIYQTDPTLTTNLQNQLDELVGKLAKMNPVDLTMINQIHDVYSKNPQDWQNMFEIQLTELNS